MRKNILRSIPTYLILTVCLTAEPGSNIYISFKVNRCAQFSNYSRSHISQALTLLSIQVKVALKPNDRKSPSNSFPWLYCIVYTIFFNTFHYPLYPRTSLVFGGFQRVQSFNISPNFILGSLSIHYLDSTNKPHNIGIPPVIYFIFTFWNEGTTIRQNAEFAFLWRLLMSLLTRFPMSETWVCLHVDQN